MVIGTNEKNQNKCILKEKKLKHSNQLGVRIDKNLMAMLI